VQELLGVQVLATALAIDVFNVTRCLPHGLDFDIALPLEYGSHPPAATPHQFFPITVTIYF
jgi:hypothetical protein